MLEFVRIWLEIWLYLIRISVLDSIRILLLFDLIMHVMHISFLIYCLVSMLNNEERIILKKSCYWEHVICCSSDLSCVVRNLWEWACGLYTYETQIPCQISNFILKSPPHDTKSPQNLCHLYRTNFRKLVPPLLFLNQHGNSSRLVITHAIKISRGWGLTLNMNWTLYFVFGI